jgi:hypothetical protein
LPSIILDGRQHIYFYFKDQDGMEGKQKLRFKFNIMSVIHHDGIFFLSKIDIDFRYEVRQIPLTNELKLEIHQNN